ncbi:hypothetical protein ACFPYI_15690 [Halomarina salina]|uniref:Uncharacterized protein n=1 Tax=Halomarina salina TaxID=1872699 RepID=A0ABD5RR18_9EURY|nr:hypothetical protein [Halomarina salina]
MSQQQLPEAWFVRDRRVNAVVAWFFTLMLVLGAVGYLLEGLLVDTALAVAAAAVSLVPPVVYRSWRRTVPWLLLFVAAIPVGAGAYGPSFLDDVANGVGIATLALLAVAALQLTTDLRMTPDVAVVFVVLTTLATAGFWALGSAASARYLGTSFLETNDQLMVVFTAALLGGVLAGGVFRWYFRRKLRAAREATGVEGVTA